MWQNLYSMPDGVAHLWSHQALCPGIREEEARSGRKLGACVDGRNLGFMLCTKDPQSSTPLLKGGWELNSNTETTSAKGCKPD